jgi:hypothetical protein
LYCWNESASAPASAETVTSAITPASCAPLLPEPLLDPLPEPEPELLEVPDDAPAPLEELPPAGPVPELDELAPPLLPEAPPFEPEDPPWDDDEEPPSLAPDDEPAPVPVEASSPPNPKSVP